MIPGPRRSSRIKSPKVQPTKQDKPTSKEGSGGSGAKPKKPKETKFPPIPDALYEPDIDPKSNKLKLISICNTILFLFQI